MPRVSTTHHLPAVLGASLALWAGGCAKPAAGEAPAATQASHADDTGRLRRVSLSPRTLQASANPSPAKPGVLHAAPNGTGQACSAAAPCSLSTAQSQLRARIPGMTGDLSLRLAGGRYALSEPLVLGPKDSGQNGHTVVWAAEAGAKPRLSGAVALTGWRQIDGGAYRAAVNPPHAFRALSVNGRPGLRARTPNAGQYARTEGWDRANQTLSLPQSGWPADLNPAGVELVVQRSWAAQRLRMASAAPGQAQANLALKREALASDTDQPPGRANDGDSSTVWQSKAGDGSYWEVGLGGAYALSEIEVVAPPAWPSPAYARGFTVRAGPQADLSDAGGGVTLAKVERALKPGEVWRLKVSDQTPRRYLAITTARPLALAEVRVKRAGAAGQVVVVTPQSPERALAFRPDHPPFDPQYAYHLEGSRSFLDAPGEFWVAPDGRTAELRPRPGEDLARAEVLGARLENVLRIEGAHDLRLSGLTFEGSDWNGPDREGFVALQAGQSHSGTHLGAGVTVRSAERVVFAGVTFRNMAASGLNVYTGSRAIQVLACRFEDLGGQGLALDAALEGGVQNVLVRDSVFTRLGLAYAGSVGLFGGYVRGVRVEHNAFSALPYSAVSLGWGWSASETRLGDNRVFANDISQVMRLAEDGAGIYVLSNQPGTLIAENHVHDLTRSPWAGAAPIAGVYLDEGSSNITVRDNVLQRLPQALNFNRNGSGNVIQNNAGSDPGVVSRAGPGTGK